jgi:hypothetical protein
MITKLEKRLLGASNNVKFPTSWEELDPVQFVTVICILLEFKTKKFDVRELQLRLFTELSNINSRKILRRDYEWFEKEIFKNLDKMSFCFKYIYDDPRFKNLDIKMQERLKKTKPEKITGEPEAVIASKFNRTVEIDAAISKQLLQNIHVGFKKYPGYRFENKGDIVDTSITAEQFVDALTIMSLMAEHGADNYIDLFISTLYCPGEYSSSIAKSNAEKFQKLNPVIKYAIVFNFESILSWLTGETKYNILFSRKKKSSSKAKQNLGFNAIIYSMTEKGYGNIKEVYRLNLIEFLELMYKNLIDSINQLADSKMSKEDISKKLNLSIEYLNQIL